MSRGAGLAIPALLIAFAPVALGVAPGTVEVRDENGAVVGTPFTGTDAVQDAVASVVTARAPESRPWSVVAGAGTYGDVAVTSPNLSIGPDAGAAVVISGVGVRNDTGGGCIDISRGAVSVTGFTCTAPSRTGVNVTLRNSEGGVSLGSLTIDRPGVDGISVTGGKGLTITSPVITSPARDGIRLTMLASRQPVTLTGGSVTGAGRDGLRLADDVRALTASGLTITGARGYGIASDDAGNSDISFTGITVTGSGRDGVLLSGGTLRATLASSTITGSTGAGVRFGGASGLRITDIPVDGSNADGDLIFDSEIRTGGIYEGLRAPDGSFSLGSEPNQVRISGVSPAYAAVAAGGPAGFSRAGPALLVGATTRAKTCRVVLRYPRGRSVYRKSGAPWTVLPGSRRVRGQLQVALGSSLLGTASTAYAPYG
ncbi:MAG: right-handed parallel beta-helix repeat-containing protein [Actinobacteria bacterium]|nr:right-handed parallel beta-helix repeat-containing protein [Actinomycetota bacterium]